ncbi:MAG: hypothetical protein F7C38_07775 [Desulfurococcales archaeon]|nr:hypothetical protein [Desulfurococcales archaeon]
MKKPSIILYTARSRYWSVFDGFLAGQGLSLGKLVEGDKRLFAISRPGASYDEVFLASGRVYRLLEKLDIETIYSLGLYAGMIKPGSWFKPSLPLAHYLAPLCRGEINCIAVDGIGEKFFLYGRRVVEPRIARWRRGLSLVINVLGEALGWGIGKIANIGGKTRRVVEPVWDMGWYLRRGG